jgi:hypothetical protein
LSPIKNHHSKFKVGDLISLHDEYCAADQNQIEKQPWDSNTFGIVLSVQEATSYDGNSFHSEIRILASDSMIWSVDPCEIKEKL